jgi:hypothetical protein
MLPGPIMRSVEWKDCGRMRTWKGFGEKYLENIIINMSSITYYNNNKQNKLLGL